MEMNKKKLLVLGGSEIQTQLISAAVKVGYYVIVCDYRKDCLGATLADKFYQINYMDKFQVLKLAKEECIDGIISNSEAAMINVAYVSQVLDLPGNSLESIKTISSKLTFREFQKTNDIFAPNFSISSSFCEAKKLSKNLRFPIIMKPCQSCGSRGTTVINNSDKIDLYNKEWIKCSEYSLDNRVMLEEFIEMKDISSFIDGDIFVYNGKIIWNGLFTSKRSVNAPMVPMTQIYPVNLSKMQLEEVKETLSKIIFTSDISYGEYNIEMYFTKHDHLFCIEINPRQGGNGIPEMIMKHSGIDYNKLLVTTAVGDNYYYDSIISRNKKMNLVSRHQVYSRENGILQEIYCSPRVKELITNLDYKVKIGERVNKCENAGDVIAFVDLEFNNREQQMDIVNNIENEIYPKVLIT